MIRATYDFPTFKATPGLFALFRGRRVPLWLPAPELPLESIAGPVSKAVPIRVVVRGIGLDEAARLARAVRASGYEVKVVEG